MTGDGERPRLSCGSVPRACASGASVTASRQESKAVGFDPNNCVLLCVEHHRSEHNQKGYHTKEHVQARRAERFERWKERMSGGSTPGGIDFVDHPSDSQIHLPSLESRD